MVFGYVNESLSDKPSADKVGQSSKRRRNQSWGIANFHAEAVEVSSRFSIRCLHRLITVSHTNYTSSPIISHLLRRHAITENSPARVENNAFAVPLMNSFFSRPQKITFSSEEWDSLTVDLIIECKLPLTIVEQPSFRRLVNYARLSTHAEINMAGADTLSNRILSCFNRKFEDVKRILKARMFG